MNIFSRTTGLSYDRVMIWPHEVVPPAPTLAALKKYNFLAAINSDPIPIGSDTPRDPLFRLRTMHLDFSNFLTLERTYVSPELTGSEIATNLFLGNPILLWRDQDFFSAGISAFDYTASLINRIQPNIHWSSFGDIIRHLFLLRLRIDGN